MYSVMCCDLEQLIIQGELGTTNYGDNSYQFVNNL